MARSTKTQKALNVNAAHGLLSRGVSVTEAATILARERGLSLRQAYRYVERARTIRRALPVGEPSVPATFKIPRDVLAQLRAYSASSGLSLSAIVTRALKRCLTSTRQRPPRQKASRVAGCYQRSLWGSVRLPVHPKKRTRVGLLRD